MPAVDSFHLGLAAAGAVVGVPVVIIGILTGRAALTVWLAGIAATLAALVAATNPVDAVSAGALVAAIAVAVVAGLATATLAPEHGGALPVVAWLGAWGVWLAVPDTEAAVVALTALTAPAALGWWAGRSGRALPRSPGWIVVLLAPCWAAAWGAAARPSSTIGALACFAVPLLAVAAERLVGRALADGQVVVLQLVGVLAAARWAARVDSTAAGLARTATVVLVLAGLVAVSLAAPWPALRPRSRPGGRRR